VEQQQKQAQKSVYSPSPVFHYPPEYSNMHDYSAPPLYHQTPNHVPTGVLTPPSDFAPQSLGTAASLEGKWVNTILNVIIPSRPRNACG